MCDYTTETHAVSQRVAKALTFVKYPERGIAMLEAVMAKSPAHALFVARKLMCDEILSGTRVRQQVIMPKALLFDPGETQWFPLPVGQVDRVLVRVKHARTVICRWYDTDGDLAAHLAQVLLASSGDVSWIWVELAVMLVECGVTTAFVCDSPESAETLQGRVLATQCATQEPILRYLALLGVCRHNAVAVAVAEPETAVAPTPDIIPGTE